MKTNLMLKQFNKSKINGTFNLLEEKTFFGAKVMDIDDEIHVTDKSIQYHQVLKTGTSLEMINNGYQFSKLNLNEEDLFILDVVRIKDENHNIQQTLQNEFSTKYNMRWEINVDIKQILIEYLFGKIKHFRAFKSLNNTNFSNNNINDSIHSYIVSNLIDRYEFTSIDLYIKYISIKDNVTYTTTTIKQFDPRFSHAIFKEENRVTNANIKSDLYLDQLQPIKVYYFQTELSTDFKFDYYFDLHYKKV